MNSRPPVFLAFAGCLAAGCASTEMADQAATAAAQQLGELQVELTAKYNEHNRYLDEAEDSVNEDLARQRTDDIGLFFQTNEAAYLAQVERACPGCVADSLPGFAQSTLSAWQEREAARAREHDRIVASLAANKAKVSSDLGKLRKLRSQLNALAAPRDQKESLKALAAYLKEVDKELDKLQTENKEADQPE